GPDDYHRTAGRHEYSLAPPAPTQLDALAGACLDVIAVGKIYDIFAGRGITEKIPSANNNEGMEVALALAGRHFEGLAFINLVDFDMVYGHRNDVDGYAAALSDFDVALGVFMQKMCPQDVLIITADHGCDPSTPSTDHSRENVPILAYGAPVRRGADLGTRRSFSCIASSIAEYFELTKRFAAPSFWPLVAAEK
ncbi:MAG: phosphopentomutase, partial [Oscillospiraceae bacterium]